MHKFWSDIAKNVAPYVPGEQPVGKPYIKLNTNESPYPPSENVAKAIEGYDYNNLRLYPDPDSRKLKSKISEYHDVDINEVFVGNGSDEVLALSFLAFFSGSKKILFPDITYNFYSVYCGLFGINNEKLPLSDEFEIMLDAYCGNVSGVIFPNPNAPTGGYLTPNIIGDFLENNQDKLVIVDEAYIDFGGESCTKLISKYKNLLVIQTFSKSRSLAGMRVGYAIGDSDLIQGLERIKNSFNSYPLDALAVECAVASLEDNDYFNECCEKIIAIREEVTDSLVELGFEILPSKANFVFITHTKYKAPDLYRSLKEKGILVRYFDYPRIDNFLRVTIGTKYEMSVLTKALKEIIHP